MSSTWLLVLTVFNLMVLSILTIQVFLKLKEKKEDLRLARGLQLLQNKISILQDLSDKTDHQVYKIVQVMDKKSADLQTNLATIDTKIAQVEGSIARALDISKNMAYQAQPTNQDIRKTNLHVQAAKLANQGFSKEQIIGKVDLNPAEIDLILKVNRDHLQFAEDRLPGWIENTDSTPIDQSELTAFGNSIRTQKESTKSTATVAQTALVSTLASATSALTPAMNVVGMQTTTTAPTTATTGTTVTPYVFKKIEPTRN